MSTPNPPTTGTTVPGAQAESMSASSGAKVACGDTDASVAPDPYRPVSGAGPARAPSP